ncbi:putative reductase [Ruegeria denitrificans]|uniref:Putative reductase n=1 Tax=Ruegeria denitrificans TaxID=1715692 RepID=A0A0P1I4Q6_9RHOB|nr:ArsC/Spx/MgsR family protein [Ruegeria denitrificans]CUJ90002.1 putative reductase [Ruegeria denitrificans]
MRLYGLKNCDTCRKALKSLLDVEFVDVRADGVPQVVLTQALERFGEALLNTRSTTWRGMDDAQRARPPLELLTDHPTLMKRPLIEQDGTLYLGWTAETKAGLGVA